MRQGIRVSMQALIAALSSSAWGGEKDEAGYLSPRELVELAGESGVECTIASLQGLEGVDFGEVAGSFRGSGAEGPAFPWILKEEDGSRSIVSCPFHDDCIPLLERGGPFFRGKECRGAGKLCRKTAGKPDCFLPSFVLTGTRRGPGQPDSP